jgi:hypothetical protein
MSFFINLLNTLTGQNKNVTVYVKPYNNAGNINGFTENNGYTLTEILPKGSTTKDLIYNMNKYRNPMRQIKSCYINGFLVSTTYELQDKLTVFVSLS